MLSSVTINCQVTKIVIKSRFSIVSIVANVTSPYALLENTLKGAIIGTCDIWDTDNWEPELMTIFVTWQLIVTLDSICNSCDVLYTQVFSLHASIFSLV